MTLTISIEDLSCSGKSMDAKGGKGSLFYRLPLPYGRGSVSGCKRHNADRSGCQEQHMNGHTRLKHVSAKLFSWPRCTRWKSSRSERLTSCTTSAARFT